MEKALSFVFVFIFGLFYRQTLHSKAKFKDVFGIFSMFNLLVYLFLGNQPNE